MAETVGELVRALLSGERASPRLAARLMTLLENEPQRLPELFQAVAADDRFCQAPLDRLMPRLVLGITGAPGCGKSTLADTLVRAYRQRFPERTIGVIAVDPSSPLTGGAVLGDRIRMMRHATDPQVFVRSMATRGRLGGLALGVRGVMHVMALAGCELVILETAGVGQAEVEVAGVADLVLLVLAPGQGDSVQLLKAGLMEIADFLIVNKADKPESAQLHAHVLAALRLRAGEDEAGVHETCEAARSEIAPADSTSGDWKACARPLPQAFLVSATTAQGVPALIGAIETVAAGAHLWWRERRARAVALEVRDAILEEARRRLVAALDANSELADHVEKILRGESSVPSFAQRLIDRTTSHAQPHDGGDDHD